jgi:hypothetical protein
MINHNFKKLFPYDIKIPLYVNIVNDNNKENTDTNNSLIWIENLLNKIFLFENLIDL